MKSLRKPWILISTDWRIISESLRKLLILIGFRSHDLEQPKKSFIFVCLTNTDWCIIFENKRKPLICIRFGSHNLEKYKETIDSYRLYKHRLG